MKSRKQHLDIELDKKLQKRYDFCMIYYGNVNENLLKLVKEMEEGAPVYDFYEDPTEWQKDLNKWRHCRQEKENK